MEADLLVHGWPSTTQATYSVSNVHRGYTHYSHPDDEGSNCCHFEISVKQLSAYISNAARKNLETKSGKPMRQNFGPVLQQTAQAINARNMRIPVHGICILLMSMKRLDSSNEKSLLTTG